KPDKDESTTVSGNNNAHSVIDDLISKNQSVAEAIRNASDSIQKVGEEFNQTDVMIGNEIGKN
ncbi:type VII secretion effector, partial [Staphylococcus aureus DAR5838]